MRFAQEYQSAVISLRTGRCRSCALVTTTQTCTCYPNMSGWGVTARGGTLGVTLASAVAKPKRSPCPRRRSTSSSSAACPTIAVGGNEERGRQGLRDAHNLGWFEVVNQRGVINNGKVAELQVVLKVGFQFGSSKAVD